MTTDKKRRALVVEDDPGMRSFYGRFFAGLEKEGYSAVVVEDGERALDILQREPIDVVLLDWNLPGISGEALLRALRAHPMTRSIGVLMVTGKSTPAEEIQALDSGADDHLAKPFDEKVLLARLHSLYRRRELTLGAQLVSRFEGLEFDADADRLRVNGRRVNLTPKEATLLTVFLRRPDVLHSHEYLWEAGWGYESENREHLLAVTVSSLRRKLGDKWGPRLKAHKGKGYALERET